MTKWDLSQTYKQVFFMFIFEREEKGCAQAGEGQREGDRGSEVGSALSVESPMWGSNPPTVRS